MDGEVLVAVHIPDTVDANAAWSIFETGSNEGTWQVQEGEDRHPRSDDDQAWHPTQRGRDADPKGRVRPGAVVKFVDDKGDSVLSVSEFQRSPGSRSVLALEAR